MPISQATPWARALWWGFLSESFALHPVSEGAHLHASCVEWQGRALLIAGPSGSGKSSLALELMALGAGRVADDKTELWAADGLWARAPATLPQAVEARGLGLLPAQLTPEARVAAALDLRCRSAARMPQPLEITLLGHVIPLLHSPASGPVAAMILQYLKQATV